MCENRVMNHVFQGVVCAIKNLTKVLIIIMFIVLENVSVPIKMYVCFKCVLSTHLQHHQYSLPCIEAIRLQ